MAKYKVLLPTAGVGSRIVTEAFNLNKSLYGLGAKPVIARVLSQFPTDIEVVVVLGFQGELVAEVLPALFPERKFSFVWVERWEGEKSGLGWSILAARDLLDCPFVFSPNDCFFEEIDWNLDPTVSGDWVAVIRADQIDQHLHSEYRGVSKDSAGNLDQLFKKGYPSEFLYTGLCGIQNYVDFWSYLDGCEDLTVGESSSLRRMSDVKVFSGKRWFDVGNPEAAVNARTHYERKVDGLNILPKPNEALFFGEDRVVKVFLDKDVVAKRLSRQKSMLSDITPPIISAGEYHYAYKKIEGSVLSYTKDLSSFTELLDWANERLWMQVKTSVSPERKRSIVGSFYQQKTLDRLGLFERTREYIDKPDTINGVHVSSVRELLGRIDWNEVARESRFGAFHGDFHNENIVVSDSGEYFLIDWRDSFGGFVEFGDVYYDLAKFYHGLIVNHGIVDEGRFTVENGDRGYFINIDRPYLFVQAESFFIDWLADNGYDAALVRILTALIFINIAPLHHTPYDLFLLELGRFELQREIDKRSIYCKGDH